MGEVRLRVSCNGDWSLATLPLPAWLTVSPTRGTAGDTEVVVTCANDPASADETTKGVLRFYSSYPSGSPFADVTVRRFSRDTVYAILTPRDGGKRIIATNSSRINIRSGVYYRVRVYLSYNDVKGYTVESRDLNMWTDGASGNIDPLVVGADQIYAATATGTAPHKLRIQHLIPSAPPNPLLLFVSVD